MTRRAWVWAFFGGSLLAWSAVFLVHRLLLDVFRWAVLLLKAYT